jgi:Ca2+-binding EF-hand superfamily protein
MQGRSVWLLVGLLMTGTTLAQEAERPEFAQVDTDQNGKLTRTEFRTQFEATVRERAKAGYPKAQRYVAMSSQQQTQLLDRMFARLDGNGDDAIDASEWQAAAQDPQFRRRPRGQAM